MSRIVANESITKRARREPIFVFLDTTARPRWLIQAVSAFCWALLPFLYILGKAFKTDRRLWLFGLRPMEGAYEFVDNSKYLFLALSNEFTGSVRPVWISWSLQLAELLRRRGYESFWIASPKAIAAALHAGCVFSHCRGGIERELVGCGRALRVELWHGIPLKFISTSASADYLVATSESLRTVFAKCLLVPPSRVIVSGYPRNDVLMGTVRGSDIGVAECLRHVLELKKRGRVVLYAPTFRDNMTLAPEQFLEYVKLDQARLDKLLIRNGTYMIVKLHSSIGGGPTYGLKRISERLYLMDERADVYPILLQADVLVTDYSSVCFDFLFLDRPIVFYVPDYEEYVRTRGFSLDFGSHTPGEKANSFDRLLIALEAALSGEDLYANERESVRRQMFDNVDGRSSARIMKSVLSILRLQDR